MDLIQCLISVFLKMFLNAKKMHYNLILDQLSIDD
jgi:hypothetical protein